MVALVFGTDAAVAIAVEACEWFVGEEGERLFENWWNQVSIVYTSSREHGSRLWVREHTIQVLHTRFRTHDFLGLCFDWMTSDKKQIDNPGDD